MSVRRDKHGMRMRLSEAQNHKCCYCGVVTSIEKKDKNQPYFATIEHVEAKFNYRRDRRKITIRRGGRKKRKFICYYKKGANNWSILAMACQKCNNLRKGMDAFIFFYRQMWQEPWLSRKLYYLRDAFIRKGNLGALKVMHQFCPLCDIPKKVEI